MTWHIIGDQLDSYLVGEINTTAAASVESHLLECGDCRQRLADRTSLSVLATSWEAVERRIDSPPTGSVCRLLDWVGLSEDHRRLLAPTAPLRLAWIGAVAAAAAAGTFLVRSTPATGPITQLVFLVVAAILPLSAVAAALGSASEPVPEITAASPLSAARVAETRVTAVLAVTIPITFVAGLALPGPWTGAALWLLPSLAMCALSTALSGRLGPGTAAAAVGSAWVLGVSVWVMTTHDRLAPFHTGPQIVYFGVAAAATGVVLMHPELMERSRSAAAFSTRRNVQ